MPNGYLLPDAVELVQQLHERDLGQDGLVVFERGRLRQVQREVAVCAALARR